MWAIDFVFAYMHFNIIFQQDDFLSSYFNDFGLNVYRCNRAIITLIIYIISAIATLIFQGYNVLILEYVQTQRKEL